MKKNNSSGSLTDINNVYGYSVSQTMVAVLKASGDNLTRENIMKAGREHPRSETADAASGHHHLDQRRPISRRSSKCS